MKDLRMPGGPGIIVVETPEEEQALQPESRGSGDLDSCAAVDFSRFKNGLDQTGEDPAKAAEEWRALVARITDGESW